MVSYLLKYAYFQVKQLLVIVYFYSLSFNYENMKIILIREKLMFCSMEFFSDGMIQI